MCTNNPTLFPWNWVLLEELIVVQLLNNYPQCFGTQKLITVFPTAGHWFRFLASLIQSTTSQPTSLRAVSLLTSRLRADLPRSFRSFVFAHQILYALLSHACPSRPPTPGHSKNISLQFITAKSASEGHVHFSGTLVLTAWRVLELRKWMWRVQASILWHVDPLLGNDREINNCT
jgi:hypothetical protein